jgi:hypothetical protein
MNRSFFNFAAIAAFAATSLMFTVDALASGGATDPIPGTSNSRGGGGSGGKKGGGGSTTTQPIVTGTLAFAAQTSSFGASAHCAGSYRIDPYYPTLSLMTVNLQVDSVQVEDGTPLYVYVNTVGGTSYPFTSNAFVVIGQSGAYAMSIYVAPGSTMSSVMVTDAAGTILFVGQ